MGTETKDSTFFFFNFDSSLVFIRIAFDCFLVRSNCSISRFPSCLTCSAFFIGLVWKNDSNISIGSAIGWTFERTGPLVPRLWFRFLRRESPLFCALLSSLAELRFYKSMHLFRITLMYSFNRANIFALMELNIKKRMEKK